MIAPQTYLTVIGVLIYTFALLMSLAKTGLSYTLNASAVIVSILIGALLVYSVNCLLTGKCVALAWIDSQLVFIIGSMIAITLIVWFYFMSQDDEKKIDLNKIHQEGREFGEKAVRAFRSSFAKHDQPVRIHQSLSTRSFPSSLLSDRVEPRRSFRTIDEPIRRPSLYSRRGVDSDQLRI